MCPSNVIVTLSECDNDPEKLIKKFLKKVKKTDVIREHLERTSFYLTKSQKRRAKIRKNKFLRKLFEKRNCCYY